jgi:twitching motility two-component system response regulator PilG
MNDSKIIKLEDFKNSKKTNINPSILIIDDDETIRKALKRVFEKYNFNVILAANNLELKNVEIQDVKCIILDVGLPWVNGLELCELFRKHKDYKNIPIIMLSAYAREDDIARGKNAGCDVYITKPFDIDNLILTVRSYLELKEGS